MDIMANMAGFGNAMAGWVSSAIFWGVICVLMAVGAYGMLVIRKRRKLDKNVLVLYDLSPAVYNADGSIDWSKSLGQFDFELTTGGWFKNKLTMNGLVDYGNEKLFRLKDMTPIYDISHNDYRKINGKNGLVVIRNPNDPKFVIPISKFVMSKDSKMAMAEIAPVDLRNSATNAIEQTDVEMQKKWEKWTPIITIALVAFVLIFSILLITQYGKHNIDSTNEILKMAIEKIGEKTSNALPSSAP